MIHESIFLSAFVIFNLFRIQTNLCVFCYFLYNDSPCICMLHLWYSSLLLRVLYLCGVAYFCVNCVDSSLSTFYLYMYNPVNWRIIHSPAYFVVAYNIFCFLFLRFMSLFLSSWSLVCTFHSLDYHLIASEKIVELIQRLAVGEGCELAPWIGLLNESCVLLVFDTALTCHTLLHPA